MARNLNQIKADIDTLRGLNKRKMVTRKDISDALKYFNDSKNKKKNIEEFLNSLNEDILTEAQKEKILNDLERYS